MTHKKSKLNQIDQSKNLVYLLVLILLMGLTGVPIVTGAETSDFQYFKLIQLPGLSDQQLLYVILDHEIYKYCNTDLSDVRVFDSKKMEIPGIIRQRFADETEIEQEIIKSKIDDIINHDDDFVELMVNIPENLKEISGINLQSSQTDFEKTVTVLGMPKDSDVWIELSRGAVIYDFSRMADVRNLTVRFEPVILTALKLQIHNIEDVTESPYRQLSRELTGSGHNEKTIENVLLETRQFRIDGVELVRDIERIVERRAVAKLYKAKTYETTENTEKKQTVINVEMRREPLTSFKLSTSSTNFKRVVRVQAELNDKWVTVGEGTVYNLDYQDIHESNLQIPIRETRSHAYRVFIENGDSMPLKIDNIEAKGHCHELVFMAAANSAYQIFWGADHLGKGQSDSAAILDLLNKGYPLKRARSGRGFTNPDYGKGATADHNSNFLNSKVFFGLVVLLLILVLGSALFKAVRKQDE